MLDPIDWLTSVLCDCSSDHRAHRNPQRTVGFPVTDTLGLSSPGVIRLVCSQSDPSEPGEKRALQGIQLLRETRELFTRQIAR
jgi:hypothetical protein